MEIVQQAGISALNSSRTQTESSLCMADCGKEPRLVVTSDNLFMSSPVRMRS